ncbi:YidC/Oxa1 family membrane protein insertase [Actinorugispora endophytica]|uniref:Membrane protein insertase YidC n=1 Tax=Actinorugispora endophytica TaxID=1605990 RepID=A0A4R6VDZ6_9ACTN|nr:membrane protein insertase YidC [Actinorugispora endophytica]TDQ55247.1 YidC/Oxa1 family membrane protein insertase [Actinorugispora endophytica]
MYTFGPIAAAISAAHTVVTVLTDALTPTLGTASAAVAIVCLTVLVRLLVLPLNYLQVRGEKARARLAPQLAVLRERYGKKPEKLVEETRKLYAKEGTSPLAGCLPGLAQTPVFIALYGLFVTSSVGGEPNGLLAHRLAGVPLGSTLTQTLGGGSVGPVLVFAVLLALLAAGAWATRRWLTLPALAEGAAGGQQQLPGMGVVGYLPYTVLLVAFVAPLAAGVYLVTSTAWTVAERTTLRRIVPAG